MNGSTRPARAKIRLITLAAILIGLAGCTVTFVSAYDEITDRNTTALHKKIDTFLVKMQSEPSAEKRKYKHSRDFYNDVLVDLNALRIRAKAIPKNSLTIEQLDLVEQNIGYLVLLHKGTAATSALTEVQIEEIKKKGVDTSASDDEANHALNKVFVPVVRGLFNSQFGAIIKFELAKKRGEKTAE